MDLRSQVVKGMEIRRLPSFFLPTGRTELNEDFLNERRAGNYPQ